MHTPSLAQYVKCRDSSDWPGVSELMLDSGKPTRKKTGADLP